MPALLNIKTNKTGNVCMYVCTYNVTLGEVRVTIIAMV